MAHGPVQSAEVHPPPGRQEDELHLLLLEARDRDRSRMREALWLSIIFHMLFLMAAMFAPKYLPSPNVVVVATPQDVLRDKELTYLQMPLDSQVPPVKRPQTDRISDKDRIATSRAPQLDRKTIEELRDARRRGTPGPGGQPSPPAMAQAAPPPPVLQPQQRTPAGGEIPLSDSSRALPQLETPLRRAPGTGATLGMTRPVSPGAAIEEATRAAASNRGGYGGAGGEYGLGQGTQSAKVRSNVDIVSDTMGVDFGPYLDRVLHKVRINWFNIIPESARAPLRKKGKVSIEFAILKDGTVAGMKLLLPSGDVALDRAAWGGITASNPFPQLPPEFRGQYLALRFHFYYNPDENELR